MVKEEEQYEIAIPEIDENLFHCSDELRLSLPSGEGSYFKLDPSAEDDDTLQTIMARYTQSQMGIREESDQSTISKKKR